MLKKSLFIFSAMRYPSSNICRINASITWLHNDGQFFCILFYQCIPNIDTVYNCLLTVLFEKCPQEHAYQIALISNTYFRNYLTKKINNIVNLGHISNKFYCLLLYMPTYNQILIIMIAITRNYFIIIDGLLDWIK